MRPIQVAMQPNFIPVILLAVMVSAPVFALSEEPVRPEHGACAHDSECVLVEVPCSCGQTKLAVNKKHAKTYTREARCTQVEVARCARMGASVARSAVCSMGKCAVTNGIGTTDSAK